MTKPKKPQGQSGPIGFGAEGPQWHVVEFPGDKAEREEMVANIFVKAANNFIVNESQQGGKYPLFSGLKPNAEDDLDFTVQTGHGKRLMELVEFAPMQKFGPTFTQAPDSIPSLTKSEYLLECISKKSSHQGGPERFLLVYATDQSFKLDVHTIEITRRALNSNTPNFERVYYVSIHDAVTGGTAYEIFPGAPRWGTECSSDDNVKKINSHSLSPKGLPKHSGS
jgi:hypothetical protein